MSENDAKYYVFAFPKGREPRYEVDVLRGPSQQQGGSPSYGPVPFHQALRLIMMRDKAHPNYPTRVITEKMYEKSGKFVMDGVPMYLYEHGGLMPVLVQNEETLKVEAEIGEVAFAALDVWYEMIRRWIRTMDEDAYLYLTDEEMDAVYTAWSKDRENLKAVGQYG
jgi:hypothetical protein